MKTSIKWIPVVALVSTFSLPAEEASVKAEALSSEAEPISTRCGEVKAIAADFASNRALEPVSESVVLEHVLNKHGEEMSVLEKSVMSVVISRLEGSSLETGGEECSDLGVSVAPIDEATRRLIQPEIQGGLRVTGATLGGVLSFWGVGEDDLIVSTNGKALHNARALQDVLDGAIEKNQPVLLEVIAQGNRRTINLLPLRNVEKLKPGAPRFWQMRGC